MSRPSPARDSNSPSIPPPTNTSSLLQYSSRHNLHSQSGGPHTTQTRDRLPSAAYSPSSSLPQTIDELTMHESMPHSPTESTHSRRSHRARTGRRRPPSPSSSSQGDMADTDAESGPSSQPEQPSSNQTSDQQVKKKRTRTLTTPHQSAVLHALLAQSRFPTTAMREEVGRQIGLSARKVQIWFQNQRQKARRPHGHNSAPHSLQRPPQFGPFPSVPMHTLPPDTAQSSWSNWQHPPSTSAVSTGHVEPTSRPSTSSEGMVLSDSHYPLQTLPPIEAQQSLYQCSSGPQSSSPERRVPLFFVPEASSRAEGIRLSPTQSRDIINLPPLPTEAHTSSGLPAIRLNVDRTSPTTAFGRPVLRPMITVSTSSNQLPDIQSAAASATHSMPPPFTLEPPPQWQPDPVLPIGPAWRGASLLGQRGPGSMIHDRSLRPSRVARVDQDNPQGLIRPNIRSPQSGSRPFNPIRSRLGDEPSASSFARLGDR